MQADDRIEGYLTSLECLFFSSSLSKFFIYLKAKVYVEKMFHTQARNITSASPVLKSNLNPNITDTERNRMNPTIQPSPIKNMIHLLPSYPYTPLTHPDSTRLLTLPGAGDDTIHLTLGGYRFNLTTTTFHPRTEDKTIPLEIQRSKTRSGKTKRRDFLSRRFEFPCLVMLSSKSRSRLRNAFFSSIFAKSTFTLKVLDSKRITNLSNRLKKEKSKRATTTRCKIVVVFHAR